MPTSAQPASYVGKRASSPSPMLINLNEMKDDISCEPAVSPDWRSPVPGLHSPIQALAVLGGSVAD